MRWAEGLAEDVEGREEDVSACQGGRPTGPVLGVHRLHRCGGPGWRGVVHRGEGCATASHWGAERKQEECSAGAINGVRILGVLRPQRSGNLCLFDDAFCAFWGPA